MPEYGKDYISKYTHMMKMWSPNNILDPYEQSAGSARKALWVCDLGHEWEARILNVKYGFGCRICSNKEVLTGFNDLETMLPEIAALYDKELNPTPASQVLSGSSEEYWFKCEKFDHSYIAKIEKLKLGNRCSYCAGKKILIGFNDFPTTAPHLLEWWDYKKNTKKPEEFSKGSHKKAWWKCPKNNHSFQKTILSLYKNTACGYCSNKVVLTGYNDLATIRPDFLEWWDYEKNTLDPTTISPYTHTRFWAKCSLNHSWQTNGDKMSAGYRCPYCGGTKTLKGYNDLETKCPEILELWNYSKNTVKPTEISSRNKKKVWWICKKEHEWEATVGDVAARRSNCPVCSNYKILLGYNDLLTHYPKIIEHWSPNNEKSPQEYSLGSGYTVELVCPKDGSFYKKEIFNFVRSSYPFCACPNCTTSTSSFEKEVNQFIKNDLKIETITSDRKIISPKELDIVIEEKKIAIECNGTYWHSDAFIQKARGISAKDHHQMKKELAKAAGYKLFFVWEDDWNMKQDQIETELLNVMNNSLDTIELLNRLE